MIKYCILDDEPIAHRIIEGYCQNLPHLQKIGNCYNAFEAIRLLNEKETDLLFLDINMPKLSGFDFLRTLVHRPKIIVTTAYEKFAVEGFELDIADYLLKPFSFERFVKAVNKAAGNTNTIQNLTDTSEEIKADKRFFLKGDKKHHQINTDDILFVEAYGNYTKVHLREERIVSHDKISSIESLLPGKDFLRVHKSFIVSLDKIKLIEGNRIEIEGHKIPIGMTYKNRVKRLFDL
ncbi:MAG TPA: LytTR family DNA-binding domain-containing protein [Salinimicrobium sp.]|nr:LytTR family DNA-binding domain-containing protein [Salinimicrobium sp.]